MTQQSHHINHRRRVIPDLVIVTQGDVISIKGKRFLIQVRKKTLKRVLLCAALLIGLTIFRLVFGAKDGANWLGILLSALDFFFTHFLGKD